jgi:hypothetical protein
VPKLFEDAHEEFSCCVCSGMDSYVRHGEYVYSHSREDLWVNLYMASEVVWTDKGVTVRQETRFPEQETSTLRISCRTPVKFGLNLRHPAWATRGMTVRINGGEAPARGGPGEFVRHERTWRDGDKVEISIPFTLRTEALPGDASRVALFHGPVLLAGEVAPTSGWPGAADAAATVLVPGGRPVSEWLAVERDPLTFSTKVAVPRPVKVKPFYRTNEEPFAVYWELLSPAEWQERQARWAVRESELRQREQRTVDRVVVGEPASEAAHQFRGKGILRQPSAGRPPSAADPAPSRAYIEFHQRTAILPERNFRFAIAPDSLSYRLQVPADGPADLVCTYFGRCPYPMPLRLFYRIKVDGTEVFAEKLTADATFSTGLHERVIPLPPEVLRGKSAVEVSLVPDAGGRTGNLMELRVVRR